MVSPIPPVPPRAATGVRALLAVRPVPRRWPMAVRAAACTGLPVLVGWLAGDVQAGLTATVGAFTALYGSGRPYRWRARLLGVIAVALAVAVTAGAWAADVPWVAVLVLAVVATAATLLCNALRVGPPGAYFIVLAASVGVAASAGRADPWRVGLLVLAGGALAWLVHLAGAVTWPRGPERSAHAAAVAAVADFTAAAGGAQQDAARRRAAAALHDAWTVLVNEQPARRRPGDELARLRAANRALHLEFAQAMHPSAQPATPGPDRPDLPIGRPRLLDLVRDAVRPGSVHRLTAVRVGLAALLAGAIGFGFGLDRAYWIMTTAVLILHQGFDWPRTAQRGLERLAGTWAGLLLAGLVLWWQPGGPALVATIVVLQFIIEWTVPRSYGLAVVFITPVALLIATGARPVDLGALLLARGADTLLGCAVALIVYLSTASLGAATRLPDAMAATLDATRAVLRHVARESVTGPPARAARGDLQHLALALADTWDASLSASPRRRRTAEAAWPAVVAIQRLAYRVLAACWELERSPGSFPPGAAGSPALHAAIEDIAGAIRGGREPSFTGDLPEVVGPEVLTVRESLVPSIF